MNGHEMLQRLAEGKQAYTLRCDNNGEYVCFTFPNNECFEFENSVGYRSSKGYGGMMYGDYEVLIDYEVYGLHIDEAFYSEDEDYLEMTDAERAEIEEEVRCRVEEYLNENGEVNTWDD